MTQPSDRPGIRALHARAYSSRWHRFVGLYVVGVLVFLGCMGWAEHLGLSRLWIGPIFLFVTVMVLSLIHI